MIVCDCLCLFLFVSVCLCVFVFACDCLCLFVRCLRLCLTGWLCVLSTFVCASVIVCLCLCACLFVCVLVCVGLLVWFTLWCFVCCCVCVVVLCGFVVVRLLCCRVVLGFVWFGSGVVWSGLGLGAWPTLAQRLPNAFPSTRSLFNACSTLSQRVPQHA